MSAAIYFGQQLSQQLTDVLERASGIETRLNWIIVLLVLLLVSSWIRRKR